MTIDLPACVRRQLDDGGPSDAVAHGGRWRSWSWLRDAAEALDGAASGAGVVGLVARNRPHHLAAYAANLAARRATVMISPAYSPAGLAAEILRLRLPALVADREDWSEAALAAARDVGSAAIATDDRGDAPSVELLSSGAGGPYRPLDAATALELPTSGTTGAPKLISLSWTTLSAAVESAGANYAGALAGEAPQLMAHPLGNVSGLGYATPPLAFGRRIVLLERFEPRAWAEAVRAYGPTRASLPPAGVRMLLDSDVPRDWLATLTLVAVGGGRLDPALQTAFEARFGLPVLPAYGATEFGGVVANWSLPLYREWGERKRGSAGRPSEGVSLRVVDEASLAELDAGQPGLLEARVARVGPGWIRTNDLASIDADGFLFVHGRADGAINRGGFKIVPEHVAMILASHPAVADAVVVGVPDARLGETPVAAVELRPGEHAEPDALRAWLRDRLPAYQLPVEIRILEALPRNASMKIALQAVKALFG